MPKTPTPEEEFDAMLFHGRERPAAPAPEKVVPPTTLVKARRVASEDLRMLDYRDKARADLGPILALHPKLKKAAEKHAVPVELLAGMASRESRAGRALGKDGYDPDKQAFGILQVDENYHKRRGRTPTSMEHIDQAAEILRKYRNQMDRQHPDWSDEERWRGAIAAYNMGPGNVKTRNNIDKGTTGGDYSEDVLHRAEFFGAELAVRGEEE